MEPQGHGIAGSRLVLSLNSSQSPDMKSWQLSIWAGVPAVKPAPDLPPPQRWLGRGHPFLRLYWVSLLSHAVFGTTARRIPGCNYDTPIQRHPRICTPSLKSKKAFPNAVGQSRVHSHRVLQAEPKTTAGPPGSHSCHRHIFGRVSKGFF